MRSWLPSFFLYVLIMTLWFFAPVAVCEETRSLTVAWWNVENLFDTLDDPDTEDDEFIPQGKRGWTPTKLAVKYLRLSHALKMIAAENRNGRYPDILAFAETENRSVVETLLSFLPGHHYAIVYHNSPDPRGIDLALAYDTLTASHIETRPYSVPLDHRSTRDVVLHALSAGTHRFYLLLNHWPSRSLGRAWSEPRRLEAARTARSVLDSLLQADPRSDIVIAGDFNDEPEDRSISDILGSSFKRTEVRQNCAEKLYNCWNETDAPGSYSYRGTWNRIDQVLVSCGLLDQSGLSLASSPFRCFNPDPMARPGSGTPFPTWKGGSYLGGYSDHFPLVLKLEIH
ncbi:endonuclease/exonuclease/phosphatase family protein [Prosthecochloris ethylica]|nr:endonuclease/exonuclease/phosphatase family protein [Prosthecochloris ethylica]